MDMDTSFTESFYSGTPESKCTPHTPVNGVYDDCFMEFAPSDIHHASPLDVYSGWKSVSFLHSPSSDQPIELLLGPPGYGGEDKGKKAADSVLGLSTEGCHLSPFSQSSEDAAEELSQYPIFKEMAPESRTSHRMNDPECPGFSNWVVSTTRYLKIGNVSKSFSLVTLFKMLQEIGIVQEFGTQKLFTDGICIVSYYDLRDSITAYTIIKSAEDWTVQYCSNAYFSMLSSMAGTSGESQGREMLCTVVSGGYTLAHVSVPLYSALSDFGDISRFISIQRTDSLAFLITYFNPQHAADMMETLDGQYLERFRLKIMQYDADPGRYSTIDTTENNYEARRQTVPAENLGTDILSPQPIRPALSVPLRRASTGVLEKTAEQVWQPTGALAGALPSRSPHPLSASQVPAPKSLGVGTPGDAARSHKGSESTAVPVLGKDKGTGHNQVVVPGKNVIDLDRIAQGLDTRTTVMLRNIPNKVDQQTLKLYIDETSKGLYNFLYLRIDFRNICNVGYAFINFLDPLDIIPFVKAKSGTRWLVTASPVDGRIANNLNRNKFNSEKVLDVTYANIQGIDQLVEKFRNSSVMDQDPSYRPKLFHSSGPLAGTEMEFPAANNILKKCRSISAAQQIGLFAPKMSATSKGVWRKRD